jgi:hypothetical protein
MIKPVATQLSTFNIVGGTALSIIPSTFSTNVFIDTIPIFIAPGTVTITGLTNGVYTALLPKVVNISSTALHFFQNLSVLREGDYTDFTMDIGTMQLPNGTPNPSPIPFRVEILLANQSKLYIE